MRFHSLVVLVPLALAGCASNSNADLNKFPYRFVSQEAKLVPPVESDEESQANSARRDIFTAAEELKKKQENTFSSAESEEKKYSDLLEKIEKYWRIKYKISYHAIVNNITNHMKYRSEYETKADYINFPVIGGLVAIAASALYKSSTESIGGLAAGVGGLTATREYLNWETKRDLHRDAAIGMACLELEAGRLYASAPTMINLFRSNDNLKSAIEVAAIGQMELSKTQSGTLQDDRAKTAMAVTIEVAQGIQAQADHNLALYGNMPFALLGAADALQARILVDGGRGSVESSRINNQIYVRLKDAAAATQNTVYLQRKIGEAKSGASFLEVSPAAVREIAVVRDAAQPRILVIDAYNALTRAMLQTNSAMLQLGEANELTQVARRIAECGHRPSGGGN